MVIDVEEIGAFLTETHENLALEFRNRFPGIRLTVCDYSDMAGEIPVKSVPGYDIHLVAGRDHCWKITSELENATAILAARRKK